LRHKGTQKPTSTTGSQLWAGIKQIERGWSISQNPVDFEKCSRKSGLKRSAFSNKFKAAFPKAEVLGKLHCSKNGSFGTTTA
jgi:hypothetical protein